MHQYQRLKNEPNELTSIEVQLVGDFCESNFWGDLQSNHKLSLDVLRRGLRRMVFNQFSLNDKDAFYQNEPKDLFAKMPEDWVKYYYTHMYMGIQAKAQFDVYLENVETVEYANACLTPNFLQKVFKQSNPYALRIHVFNLHNRMHYLMTHKESVPDWRARADATYTQAQACLTYLAPLFEKHPAFAHFLSAYTHYTLAMGASHEHAAKHFEECYKELVKAQKTELKLPKASFMVNLGQGLYKDMPFNNLEVVKEQLKEFISPARMSALEAEAMDDLSRYKYGVKPTPANK